MTFAVNHISASIWPYDENRKFRYQPKKMKARPMQKSSAQLLGENSHFVSIEA